MQPEIRRLSEFDDPSEALMTYRRVESAAFGAPLDGTGAESKRPLVEHDLLYLASLDGEPCGTTGSFPMELTLPGGAQVRVAGVSDVGVLPTHRRRGVLRSLMRQQLQDCADRGDVAAVLHASEGSIYRRFGYGPATQWRQVRIDTRSVRFRADRPRAGGSCTIVPRSDAHGLCAAVHDRVRRATPGGLSRSDAWWDVVLGDGGSYIGGDPKQLLVVHHDGRGAADGYALYRVHQDWSTGQARHTLAVWELVGTSVAVELELWHVMCTHDLVVRTTGPISVDHALWDVVEDPRQVGVDWEQDLLWVRLLDVAAALTARTYRGNGSAVIEVRDELLDLGGVFALDVRDGIGTCGRVAATPELALDVSDLGSLLLGGTTLRRLARAGRVGDASTERLDALDMLLPVDPAPWCWVRF